jgi:ornithine cyclodeaminase/alanine dehydrogenase-like protein (mu-crystallin family)
MRIGKRNFASRKRKIAGLCAFVLAGVIGVGAYAFTAANTVKAQDAGAGVHVVGGYEQTKGVYYEWNVAGTENTAVDFVLKGELKPSDVKVAVTKEEHPSTEAEWSDCPEANIKAAGAEEYEVKCELATAVPNANADHLTIAAVSEGEVKIK